MTHESSARYRLGWWLGFATAAIPIWEAVITPYGIDFA